MRLDDGWHCTTDARLLVTKILRENLAFVNIQIETSTESSISQCLAIRNGPGQVSSENMSEW
jgi:hypothetical protein